MLRQHRHRRHSHLRHHRQRRHRHPHRHRLRHLVPIIVAAAMIRLASPRRIVMPRHLQPLRMHLAAADSVCAQSAAHCSARRRRPAAAAVEVSAVTVRRHHYLLPH